MHGSFVTIFQIFWNLFTNMKKKMVLQDENPKQALGGIFQKRKANKMWTKSLFLAVEIDLCTTIYSE